MKYFFTLSLSLSLNVASLNAALETSQDYLNGVEALANHLPEVAAERFESALLNKELSEEEKKILLFALVESQVRSLQGGAAIETLANPLLENSETKTFWTAQAYFAQGRLQDAVGEFHKVLEFKEEEKVLLALSALSELYRSLGQPENAFKLLENSSKDGSLSESASVQLVEYYLEKGQLNEAKLQLDKLEPVKKIIGYQKDFLLAKLDFLQGELDLSVEKSIQLLAKQDLPLGFEVSVQLQLMAAYLQQNKVEESIHIAVEAIDKKAESPYLYLFFNKLILILEQHGATSISQPVVEKWLEKVETKEEGGDFVSDNLDRDAYARFLLSYVISNLGVKEDFEKGLELLESMRTIHPSHGLVPSSFHLSSAISMLLEEKEEAIVFIKLMEEHSLSQLQKEKAQTLEAILYYEQGDIKSAQKKFKEVSQNGSVFYSELAHVNRATLRLVEKNYSGFSEEVQKVGDETIRAGLLFEQALLQQKDSDAESGLLHSQRLESLIKKFPEHSLADDARLALAVALINKPPYDGEKAVAFLEKISPSASPSVKELAQQVKLNVNIAAGKWSEVIEEYSQSPEFTSSEANKKTISIAEAYYRNGEYVKTRREFSKVLQSEELAEFHEFAYFFSALAAKKEGTPQGKEESDSLLQKVISLEGDLVNDAYLHYSRSLIDQGESEEVVELVLPLLEKDSAKLKIEQLGLHYMLAEAFQRMQLQAEGAESVALIQRAVKVYDDLLKHKELLSVTQIHKTLFLKAGALEKTQDMRGKAQALSTYFQVVNLEFQEDKTKPAEWDWYYKCGLKAVDLLEKQERYKSAVALLEKMANTFGPKYAVLIEKVEKLKLKHLIW